MVQLRVIEKLNKFLPNPNAKLVTLILRLIMNLSFDHDFCDQVATDRILIKIVELLKVSSFRAIGISILYQLTKSEKVRAALTLTECIPIMWQLIVKFPEPQIAPELVSLAVNLTNLKKNCEVLVTSERFEPMLVRAIKHKDSLLFKVIKNIVSKIRHKDVQSIVNKHLSPIVKMAFNPSTTADFRIELLGVIAYTDCREWESINKDSNLIQ